MRLLNSLRRPMGGYIIEPGEQQAEAARTIEERLSRNLDRKLSIEFGRVTRKMELIMRTLAEVLDLVSQQKTKIDSLNTLMDGVRAEVGRLLANSSTDQTTQQLVDQVFDRLKENTDAIDAAIAENTSGDQSGSGKSSAEILADNNAKKSEEIGAATTAEPVKEPEPTPAPAPEPEPQPAPAAAEAPAGDASLTTMSAADPEAKG